MIKKYSICLFFKYLKTVIFGKCEFFEDEGKPCYWFLVIGYWLKGNRNQELGFRGLTLYESENENESGMDESDNESG